MVAYSFKERFIWPIKVGLGLAEPDSFGVPLPKRQTIRAIGKRRHARPAEVLQLYYGMRTRQCRLIGVAQCVSVKPIQFWIGLDYMAEMKNGVGIKDGFARADGFADAKEMFEFWRKEHGGGYWNGVIIKWTPISQQLLESADD